MSKCKGCKDQVIIEALRKELDAIFVGTELRNKRLDICYACEKYDAAQGTCTECGCYILAKTASRDESCPLAEPKW